MELWSRLGGTAVVVAVIGTVAGGERLAGQQTPPDLSDAEVAHVAVTANAIDVELARLAIERAGAERVKQFARTMVAHHDSVNAKAAALSKKLGVEPAEHAVSRDLRAGAEEAKQKLEALSGSAFDRAYMEREVGYHRAVLGALDDLLIPTTENSDLRALLGEARDVIAGHLRDAEAIVKEL